MWTLLRKNVNAESLDDINNLKLFELAVNAYSRTRRKHNKNECRPPNSRNPTEKTTTGKPPDSKFNNDEKKEVLTWRNTLLRQVKSYIDNNLNPAKVNMIDPTKENFTQPLHIKEILDEFEISMDDYYRALKRWRFRAQFEKTT